MQRSRWVRVSSRAALSGAVLLLLTSCSTSDIEKRIRWGWPTGVTKQAERMRVLWSWSGVVALAVGVLVWGLIFWCCGRYHKRNDEIPRQTKYNLPIEIVYTVVPLMIIAGLFFFTVRVEDFVDRQTPNPNVTVQVNAFKWNWQFEYLKANGTDQNYPGVSPPQPLATHGSSGEIPILLIPRGQTVQFVEHSEDVIHSFWVPEFLFKRDVIPYGTDSTTHDNRFEITRDDERALCRPVCRVVRDLPLADELRGTGCRSRQVHVLPERSGAAGTDRSSQSIQGVGGDRRGAGRDDDASVQHRSHRT